MMAARGIVRAGGTPGDMRDGVFKPFRRTSLVPFEKLPNLPKARIPVFELDASNISAESLREQAILQHKKIEIPGTRRATQTDESHIVDVKQVTGVIETLLLEVEKLRNDLDYAQQVLRADYGKKLKHIATELYCRVNEKVKELEKHQAEKLEKIRGSYRQQLVNAIQKIAGEYKAYYDELMSGKSGRHDLKIKDLKEKLMEQERMMEVQSLRLEEVTTELEEMRAQQEEEEDPLVPGISQEEAEELKETIALLETQLNTTSDQLAAKEESEKKLSMLLSSAKKELETERGCVAQLKRDMEGLKKKSKAEKEKAARLAEGQRVALEKEMKEKMEKAHREASFEAERLAEEQRRQSQMALDVEREKSRRREKELLNQQSVIQPVEKEEAEIEAELARLQLVESRQKETIIRLQKEIERVNKIWTTKLAIMKKNFHALRDESFLRSSLQRQAANLHHATLGYSVDSYHSPGQLQTDNNIIAGVRNRDTLRDDNPNTNQKEEQRLSISPPPSSPTQSASIDGIALQEDKHNVTIHPVN